MGRQALAVLCWLAITEASLGTVINLGIKDNENAESAPRLYRNAPYGVYASAAPYGAFSYHVPTSVPAKAAQLIPVKQESIFIQNSNGFLKDSYGNKFVETPQSVAYKTSFPQQYVQLQHLPAHLSQPLSAAPSYHFPQGPPQAFFGAQYRLPSLDAVTSPFTRYGVSQPFVYAGGVKSLTPASDQQFHFVAPKAQQGSNNQQQQQVIYGTPNYNPKQGELKFQRLEEKPAVHHIEHHEAPRQPQVAQSIKSQVQAPVRHTVKTTHNGEDTLVHIETKPPLPLLDLSLLEPLTFANPVVPQVQHYLPKINAVTYNKLHPADVDEVKKHKNEFVVQKTKSYDSEVVKGKPHSEEPKKKQKKPPKKDTNVHVHYEHKSEKPSIKVKGKPNDAEYSYEIKSPNYKETYNEQVVSYNKETKKDPVSYSYQKETQKEPVTYSFSHSSKDPGHTKKVQYVKKDPGPNHLVYNFQPAEQGVKHNDAHHPNQDPETDSEDSDESSEGDDETPAHDHAQFDTHQNRPSQSHTSSQSHHSTPSSHSHQSNPASYNHHSHPSTSHHSHNPPHSHSSSQSHHPSTHSHNPTHSHSSAQSHHPSTNPHNPTHSHSSTQSHHPSSHSHNPTHSHSSTQSNHPSIQSHHSTHSHPQGHAHPSPHPHYSSEHRATHSHQSHPQHFNVEHESHNPNQAHYTVTQEAPQYFNHPQLTPLQEFMENLRFIPAYTNAAIRVDPNQHIQKQQQKQQVTPQYYIQQTTPHARSEGQVSSEPVIYEKSKKIIIQEESPDEVHSHQEKLTAQMVGQEENNEEDFEKSYKEAAYGFPAYERDSSDSEDEIYNPDTYGEPRNSEEDSGKHFEEYQEEGDEFPKFARLGYRDDRDKRKENYYQEYSIQKPESMTDRYQSKINYYKMFLKHKPEKLRHSGNGDKNKQLAKYTVDPSFYESAPKQKTKQSAAYKAAPVFEYDYLKDSRDSSPHASRPHPNYKSRTHFVEPQFQYGFEPIAIPRLDSELDTMASNVSPESEKPGTRKKVYKENWYIKKTSTSSKPS